MRKFIEKNKTNLLYVGAGLGIAYVVYSFFKKKKDDKSGGSSDEDIKIDALNLSYDPLTYKVLADGIETSIWGSSGIASWWEDDAAVGDILKKMNTIDDVKALIQAYGNRFVGTLFKDGGNLAETVSEYLDTDIKASVNQDYNTKNINFQWS